jgi:penicillin-binding protein 1A
MRRIVRAVSVFVLSTVVVPVGVATTVLASFLFLPLPATLPVPKATIESQISHIYDINGNEIGLFRKFETAIPFRKEDVPLVLKQAVISAEDKRFYQHGGVDIRGTARAFWADYRNRRAVQGGSTITQQYVKNAYTGQQRTVVRKLREAILASQLDRQIPKEDILYKYLSTIYLGNGAYGAEAASELYFRKPVKAIDASEAAMLAGLIPAPSRWEPLGNPNVAEQKRQQVLREMLGQHYLTPAQYADANSRQLWFASAGPPSHPATLVYRPQIQQSKFPYFRDYVERYLKDRYGDRLYSGGLRIQTTLDPDLQAEALATVAKQLGGTAPPLDMALVAIEPPTGFVKALVGGRDFYAGSQVNLALGGCPAQPTDPRIHVEVRATCWDHPSVGGGGSGRQPGSSFKPFTLATAFEQGVSPGKVFAAPTSYLPKSCRAGCDPAKNTIHNNEGEGGGSVTLREGLAKSINTVFAQLIEQVGVRQTIETAKKLGITSEWYSPQLHGLSITLGAEDVSPLDMASAYGVFANGGKRVAPTPVVRVTDGTGKVLEDHTKPVATQVIPQVVADNVTDVMKGVIAHGTGTAANIGRPAAGKTGTTDSFINAWFVGFTPTLSTSVWMGYANNQKTPLLHIKGVSRVFGGTIPAQTWHDFMVQAVKDVPVTDFNQPAPIRPVTDELSRQARQGIDPGTRRTPASVPDNCDGPCQVGPPPPVAVPPPTPTSEPPPSLPALPTTTTSPGPIIRAP